MSNYSQRRAYWPTQQTLTEFTPTSTNSAGSIDFGTQGNLVCGAAARGVSLIWTTVDLWILQYIGAPLIYRIDKAGDACGIIAPKAFAVIDTEAFWMGYNGFFRYNGFVSPIPCDVQDYVFGSLNRSHLELIWCLSNNAFGEITWFYPSASATTPDRYVTFNHWENHWVFGALNRACGVSFQAPGSVPVLIDSSGNIYDHETGTARNSEGTPNFESGPIEVGEGDRLVLIDEVVPDDKTVGDVNLTVYGATAPNASEVTYGPFALTATAPDMPSLLVKARQVRLKFTELVANAWRVGNIRLGGKLSSPR